MPNCILEISMYLVIRQYREISEHVFVVTVSHRVSISFTVYDIPYSGEKPTQKPHLHCS